MKIKRLLPLNLLLLIALISACSTPKQGADKALGGAVLGAAWGAGSGAIIGNQLSGSPGGEGAAVGAGFGLVGGAMSGLNHDAIEDMQIQQQQELDSLEIQNAANAQKLANLQATLDQAISADLAGGIYQVYFDVDATSLRSGSIANLQAIAEAIKMSPHAELVQVIGHSDDSGNPNYNDRLSEARARNVSAYLAARGISMDQIIVSSHGAKRPIASNNTPVGRQLNRRVDVYISHK